MKLIFWACILLPQPQCELQVIYAGPECRAFQSRMIGRIPGSDRWIVSPVICADELPA